MILGDLLGVNIDSKETNSTIGLVSSNHNVGVEIEIEGVPYEFSGDCPDKAKRHRFLVSEDKQEFIVDTSKHWYIVRDNSLRNGSEFIFNNPKKGKDIIEALDNMSLFFNTYNSEINKLKVSDRCSIHVHLDIRDINEERLNRFLICYILVERLLFRYVNPARLKNNYCRPIVDSTFKFVLADLLDKSNYSTVLQIIRNTCDKYSALNLLPMATFGSVEFRHHQGTYDMKELLDWINIIISIKLMSQYQLDELEYFILSKGYGDFLKKFFADTPLADDNFILNPDVKVLFNKGYLDFKEISNFSSLYDKTKLPVCRLKDKDFLINFMKHNNLDIPEKPKVKSTKPKLSPFVPTSNLLASFEEFYTNQIDNSMIQGNEDMQIVTDNIFHYDDEIQITFQD